MQSILYKGYLFLQSSFQKQFYCQKVNTITDDTIFCIMLNNPNYKHYSESGIFYWQFEN